MTVNGVTSVIDSYPSYSVAEKKVSVSEPATTEVKTSGVVYEPTLEMPTRTFKLNKEVIEKFKADANERTLKLRTLVEQLITKQGKVFNDANDIWGALKDGNLKVDPKTQEQAKEDISEDGYWGVKQTSDRIIDFAVALTGGNKTKLDSMITAFKKGYEQAEKAWGGKLPEISKNTYDAVLDKFDKLKESDI